MRLRRSLPSRPHLATSTAAAGLLLLAAGSLVSPSLGSEQLAGLRAGAGHRPGHPYAITPERRALLNTIRYAEGTWKQGQAGYRMLYGGEHFSSLERHPERLVVKRYASAAAGAYQFLPGTWREAATQLELSSFNPRNQDQAALYLVDRRGVLEQIDRRGLTRETMAVLAKEWASFPTLAGQSAYGQPVKEAQLLERFYRSNLQSLVARA